IALISWAAIYAYGELPIASVWLFEKVETPSLLWAAKLLLALAVMLPPATLMGATFPFLVRAAARSTINLERPVGQLYGASTVGAVIGAFAGGFILLPTLHVLGTVLAAASFNLIAALLAVSAAISIGQTVHRRRLAWCTSAALLAIIMVHCFKPPWNPMVMTSGMYHYSKQLQGKSRKVIREHLMNRAELLFYDEGLSSVVTVARHRSTGNIWLANNGKVDASSSGDLKTQVLLAHIPFAFRPDSEKVLIIGLASGITAGSVTLHEAPTHIDITEIEPAIVAASHIFDKYNHRPLEDPRVSLVLNDARNHLQLAKDGA
ncbi:MAG: fused MFS/spermidine synthase, partial [Pseudomonadales bacterium]